MQKQTVTLTNRLILDSMVALGGVKQDNRLIQKGLAQEPLEVEVGFNVGDNYEVISKAADRYYAYRLTIIKKFAEVDEQGEPLQEQSPEGMVISFPAGDAKDLATKEVNTLLDVEVPLDVWTFSVLELKAAGMPRMAPELLNVLNKWMINHTPENTTKEIAAQKRKEKRK